MRLRKPSSVLVSALMWCAGCYENSVVGTSGKTPEELAKPAPPAAASKTKVPTVIAAARGESLGLANPVLGDIDGDGFDDFLVTSLIASTADTRDIGEESLAYLYYGRPDFPAQLSTADADAVFRTNGFDSAPLGDIDGDRLADFALARFGSSEIVFGSRVRLHGTYTPNEVGPQWEQPALPEPFSPRAVEMRMRGAGDVDADGFDDIIVQGAKVSPEEAHSPFGLNIRRYLVPGHAGEWPSATWDMSQAVAEFGYKLVETPTETYALTLTPFALGDLDGDGSDDLGAHSDHGLFVFYGGKQLRGVLGPEQADAHLSLRSDLVFVIGDADNDGANDLVGASFAGEPLAVYYGRRWSGEVSAEPDLELQIDDIDPNSVSASAGDIDGDGLPEIVIGAAKQFANSETEPSLSPTGSLFVLRGTGSRQRGRRVLNAGDVLKRGPERWSPAQLGGETGFGWALNMSGDFDGDGGKDILTSSFEAVSDTEPMTAVYLIPSTPKTPD